MGGWIPTVWGWQQHPHEQVGQPTRSEDATHTHAWPSDQERQGASLVPQARQGALFMRSTRAKTTGLRHQQCYNTRQQTSVPLHEVDGDVGRDFTDTRHVREDRALRQIIRLRPPNIYFYFLFFHTTRQFEQHFQYFTVYAWKNTHVKRNYLI